MISVIMPVYNVEKYVGESIQSVVNQTYPDWELIVVNDGSTDNTISAVTGFDDKRIKIINQENQGVSVARNVGIDSAQGEFIAFLDGDDIYEPNFLEIMVGNINGNFIHSGHYDFWDNGKRQPPRKVKTDISGFLLDIMAVHMNSILVRKSFLIELGIRFTPGCIFGEDTEFMAKCSIFTLVEHIPQVLIGYRQSREGAITTKNNNLGKNISGLGSTKRLMHFFDKYYDKEDKREILVSLKNECNYKAYRTILEAIRRSRYKVANSLLEEFPDIKLSTKHRKIRHLIKLKIIKSNYHFLWRFL